MKHLSLLLAAFCSVLLTVCAGAQANGKLQIHHMDVGQGDGAILISPGKQVVVFDIGEDMKQKIARNRCRILINWVLNASTTRSGAWSQRTIG